MCFMKKIIICFAFLMCAASLIGQNEKTVPTFEISISTFQTNMLVFNRNYVSDFDNDVFSSNTAGYSVSGRRTQSILLKNLNWFVGGRVGVHAYSIDLMIQEEFRNLGWNEDFTSFNKNYELLFIDIFTGLRYDFSIGERMKIGIETAAVFDYHLRMSTGFGYSAGLDNGQTKELFDSEMVVNKDNQIRVFPQFGLSYQYQFKNSGLRFAAYTLVSSKNVLTGSYQLFGDNETLTGTLAKDYSFGGLELGYFWNLGR
jgi:hypothetical protein